MQNGVTAFRIGTIEPTRFPGYMRYGSCPLCDHGAEVRLRGIEQAVTSNASAVPFEIRPPSLGPPCVSGREFILGFHGLRGQESGVNISGGASCYLLLQAPEAWWRGAALRYRGDKGADVGAEN